VQRGHRRRIRLTINHIRDIALRVCNLSPLLPAIQIDGKFNAADLYSQPFIEFSRFLTKEQKMLSKY